MTQSKAFLYDLPMITINSTKLFLKKSLTKLPATPCSYLEETEQPVTEC